MATPATEQHFTVDELASLWRLSRKTVSNIVWNKPGVLKYTCPTSRGKREYVTYRIPRSVAERIHAELSR
jgi:hypothetical protein